MPFLSVKPSGLRTKPLFWSTQSESHRSFTRARTMFDTITADLQPVWKKKVRPEQNLCKKCSENGSPGEADLLENDVTHSAVYLLLGKKGAWDY